MVEYTLSLDSIFSSLADPIRRDILKRVTERELNISDIAMPYPISLAAISKHLKILERAQLIIKRKQGKEQFVTISPVALKHAGDYIDQYASLWDERFDRLESLLKKGEK
ncbi:MAG: Transcriptional regulator, ArsR family [Candidatus Saccharibacteria bacterium]|nr:Transcriptional regulator, ArsR family [Candidatus Saccharibacteria bacterium]